MPKTVCFRTPGRCLGRLWLFVVPLAAVVLLTAPGMSDEKPVKGIPTLEEALVSQAPAIRAFLWEKMKHPQKSLHIGVVKFLVQRGNRPPSDNAGPLNWHIARRLEAALIMTLDPEKADAFRILHLSDPSEDLMGKANHLRKEGRKAFFQAEYKPAWGTDGTIPAHVFLTGLVKIAYRERTMQVMVKAFDETGKELVEVCSFPVAAEPRLLTEAGESFALPRGSIITDELVVDSGKQALPPEPPDVPDRKSPGSGLKPKNPPTIRQRLEEAPIEFQVFYQKTEENEAKEVAIEEDGTLREEPTEGTKVSFHLRHKNKNRDKHTYGVVVKVNGENTICREEVEPDDLRAHKWILEPKANYPITGYLRKGRDNKAYVETFKVLPPLESKLEEVNYGSHAGTITLVIFQGRTDGKEQPEGKESKVVSRGVPKNLGNCHTLKELQDKLRHDADSEKHPQNGGSRGLIVPGEEEKLEVDTVKFNADPAWSRVIQLRYYKPRSRN